MSLIKYSALLAGLSSVILASPLQRRDLNSKTDINDQLIWTLETKGRDADPRFRLYFGQSCGSGSIYDFNAGAANTVDDPAEIRTTWTDLLNKYSIKPNQKDQDQTVFMDGFATAQEGLNSTRGRLASVQYKANNVLHNCGAQWDVYDVNESRKNLFNANGKKLMPDTNWMSFYLTGVDNSANGTTGVHDDIVYSVRNDKVKKSTDKFSGLEYAAGVASFAIVTSVNLMESFSDHDRTQTGISNIDALFLEVIYAALIDMLHYAQRVLTDLGLDGQAVGDYNPTPSKVQDVINSFSFGPSDGEGKYYNGDNYGYFNAAPNFETEGVLMGRVQSNSC